MSAEPTAPVEPVISPIGTGDLEEVGRFLHEHLNRRFTAQAWREALLHPWCESRPNFGMQLRADGALVGVLCAIYSDQVIAGAGERFCNPHSWCVLPAYRRYGIGLILSLLRQSGYHFTMLTPNPKVAEIFRHLRFKDLADTVATFPNLPSPAAFALGRIVESRPEAIANLLAGPTRRDYLLHRDIPWLRFVVFGRAEELCLVVYKRSRWKRMPAARLLHVSDPVAFGRHFGLLTHHLLTKEGLLTSRIEARFLARAPRLALRSRRMQAKLVLSRTLPGSRIFDLYSELVALDV